MLTSDETGERLGSILTRMEKAKVILDAINVDYDMIRADRYDKFIRELYMSDSNLQDAVMSVHDAIMYIKHEIAALECDE